MSAIPVECKKKVSPLLAKKNLQSALKIESYFDGADFFITEKTN